MTNSRLRFNAWASQLDGPERYKILYGGRGSGKSWCIARKLILKQLMSAQFWLCTRELQKSVKTSVKKLLENQIEEMGFSRYFDIRDLNIKGRFNRSETIFLGLAHNSTEIKSLEGLAGAWVEEAERTTKRSWNLLKNTVRLEGSQLWANFNPEDELSFMYQEFIVKQHPGAKVLKVNYYDNAFFPEVLREEMLHDKENDEALYRHIWLGEPLSDPTGKIINPIWISAAVDAHKKLNFKPEGRKCTGLDVADGGVDFTAMASVHGPIVQYLDEWKTAGGDVGVDAQRAYNHALGRQDDLLIYDSIGVGAGVKSKTNELNLYRPSQLDVIGFNAASSAIHQPDAEYQSGKSNRDMFANVKSQAWWALRERFHKTYIAVKRGGLLEYDFEDLISLPSDLPHLSKLKAELGQPLTDYDGVGRVLVESKKKLKKRGIDSTNLADSLVMCYAPSAVQRGVFTGGAFTF